MNDRRWYGAASLFLGSELAVLAEALLEPAAQASLT
jgi:hypothetical protein